MPVHAALSKLPIGRTPQFSEMAMDVAFSQDKYGNHGWRLESFIADEVLRCREGRLFEHAQDPDLDALLYFREQPIASFIYIAIDLPSETGERKA